MFSDSVSSADGIHSQRPLEQRSNVRGLSASGHSSSRADRPPRGRARPLNDRTKPSSQQPGSAPSHVSNDVTAQSTVKTTTVSTGKEAGDSAKSASEKSHVHNQSKLVSSSPVNNTAATGTETTPSSSAVSAVTSVQPPD